MGTYLIKEEFSSLDEEKRKIFLEYFSKSLEEITDNWQSKGEFGEDELEGFYYIGYEETTLRIEEDRKEVLLKFKSVWKKGMVDSLEINCDDESFNLIQFMQTKITQALAYAFGQRVESFFFRTIYYYIGNRLDGDYYIQNWRISPATPPSTHLFAESAIHFDMKVEGISRKHAYSIFDRTGKEIMAILSVILNLGIYKYNHEYRWVYGDANDSELLPLGYQNTESYPEEMPPKISANLGAYVDPAEIGVIRGSLFNNISAPNNIRKLFRAYQNLDYIEKDAFLSAARMFQLALSLGRHNTTVNVSYQIAALDTLSKPIRENNKNKNAILSLINQFSPGDESLVGRMYDRIRSAHFHEGYFSSKDTDGLNIGPFSGPMFLFGEEDTFLTNKIVRKVLINWLSERVTE